MGVHLTFVRSVDLDEWTQPQIDAMRIGGNANARQYFRKHGFTDLYGGKTEKKYKAKPRYRTKPNSRNSLPPRPQNEVKWTPRPPKTT
jgi:ADP-ribosylation factor GTPase-activating protein 2/3